MENRGSRAVKKAIGAATRGINAGAAATLVLIVTGVASRVNMIDGLLAATLEGIVDTLLAETISGFDEDTGAAAIAIISGLLPAVGGIASTIIAAMAELAAIGAASSATYHTATRRIVTFLSGAAAIGITFVIYKGISKSYGV
jgi:hypothetical protein